MRLSNLFRQKVFVLLLMLVVTPVPGADEAALTNEDILRLMQAGLGTELIIARIRSGPTNFDLSVEQLVGLKEAGIADSVIAAMMDIETEAPTEAEKPPEDEESFIVTYPAPETSPESPAEPDSAAAEADAHTAARPSQEEQVEELMAQADDGELPITTLPGFEELMTCAATAEGGECWMELANQPGCYIWNAGRRVNESATWSGGCTSGLAEGTGEIIWSWESDGYQKKAAGTGQVKGGKQYGQWVERWWATGAEAEGPYVDGKRHGQWVTRNDEGNVGGGSYVDGEKHGRWVDLVFRQVWEGPYVDGERHGHWVQRLGIGRVNEGLYVDGKAHGRWVMRFPDGTIEEGSLVDGKRHGWWVIRWADGDVQEGPYVDNEMHGQWITRHPDGTVSKRTYVNGSLQ